MKGNNSSILRNFVPCQERLEDRIALVADGAGFSSNLLVAGLSEPTSFDFAPDGRIFVTEKAGRIKVVENGAVVSTFLDINQEVNSGIARGMLSVKLDPDFATNQKLYVHYTVETDPLNPDTNVFGSPAGGEIISIQASLADPNVADPATKVVILDGHEMTHGTHSVGDIDFDNDGNLIFTWGDGGFVNSLRLATQDPTSKQGKLFRIDPNTLEGVPDNPGYDVSNPNSVASKVWAIGLRNPWRLTVHPTTGDVYIADVTDDAPEEVNLVPAGASTQAINFGWPYFEGNVNTSHNPVPPPGFTQTLPWLELPHTELPAGDNITGGVFYDGNAYPTDYDGRYFFANFRQNTLYTADATGTFQQFGTYGAFDSPVDFEVGPDGTIYYASLFTGSIFQLVHGGGTPNLPPTAFANASVTAGATPLSVSFDSVGSSDPNFDPLTYSWDFDNDGIEDAVGPTPTHSFTTLGRNLVTLTVSDNQGGSDTAVLEIDVLAEHPGDGNLALGRRAIQSSIANGGLASRAVDGNTDGIFANGSVALTANELTPFFEIDLGAVHNVERIEIFAPTDGSDVLEDYRVLVSDTSFGSANLAAATSAPGVDTYAVLGSTLNMETITVARTARFVRVQMANTDVLPLTEVRVIESDAQAPVVVANQTVVAGDIGETITVSGTYSATNPETVSLSTTYGSVTDLGGGNWEWSVTLDSNSESQIVNVQAVDGNGLSGNASIDLTYYDRTIALVIDKLSITEAEEDAVGTVTRATADLSTPLVVNIAETNPGQVTVPATVTIPIGAASADFDVTAIDDLNLDGDQTVGLSASAPGFFSDPVLPGSDAELLYFPFDDGTPTDQTGLANGELTNGASIVLDDPEFGQVLDVSGAQDEYMRVPNQTAIEVGTNNADFSVSFWFKLEESHNGFYRRIMQKGNSALDRTFGMWMLPDSDTVQFSASTLNWYNETSFSSQEVTVGQWTHLAYVKEANQLKFFMDGVPSGTLVLGTDTIPNDGDIYIGGSTWGGFVADARYDDILLVDRALQTNEVAELATRHNTDSSEATLLVTEFEQKTLQLSVNPSSVFEFSGPATGTVTRDPEDIHRDLTVDLVVDDTSEASVPATVLIPAGQVSADFPVTPIDDAQADGAQLVTITASNSFYSSTVNRPGSDAELTFYPFDDGTANDAAGLADGEFVGGAQTVVDDAEFGQVLEVSGDQSEYFRVPNQSAVEIGDNNADFSLAFWFKLQEGNNGFYRRLMQKGSSALDRTFGLWMLPDSNTLQFSASTTNWYNETAFSSVELSVGQWTHVTYVKEGNQLLLYLDGELDTSNQLSADTISNTGDIYIGGSTWGGYVADARYDDVYLVDRALQPTEVSILATQNAASGNATTTLIVQDFEESLSLTLDKAVITEAEETSVATVTRTGDTSSPLNVGISAANGAQVSYPSMVTIPIGASTATFDVTGIDDLAVEGDQTVVFTASAPGFGNAPRPGIEEQLTFYPFDDGTPNDQAGLANGTLVNGASIVDEDEVFGQVLDVSGAADQYFRVANQSALEVGDNNDDFSLAFWFKPEVGHSNFYRRIMQKGNDAFDRTFGLWMIPNENRLQFSASTENWYNESEFASSLLTVGQWTHVTYVKNGNSIELYLDGVLDASRQLSANTVSNTGDIYIGGAPWGGFVADARYDDVYLLERALTANEVSSLAASHDIDGSNATLVVTDFEQETLLLSVTPDSILELGGTATGTVTRHPSDIHRDLTVAIAVDDTSEVTAPATVTIPAGQASADFTISAVNETETDGDQLAKITVANSFYAPGVNRPGSDAELAFYPFDDGTPNDETGLADGQLVNGATIVFEDTVFGDVLDVSGGMSEYMLVQNQSALEVGDNNDDFSLAFWFKLEEGPTGFYRRLMQKGNDALDRTFGLWMLPSSNTLQFSASTTNWYNETGFSSVDLDVGQWTHIAYVKEGNQLRLYLDGAIDNTRQLSANTVSNDGDIYIGGSTWGGFVTDARYDDIYLVDRAIQDGEVAALATQHALISNPSEKTITVIDDDGAMLLAAAAISSPEPMISGKLNPNWTATPASLLDVAPNDTLPWFNLNTIEINVPNGNVYDGSELHLEMYDDNGVSTLSTNYEGVEGRNATWTFAELNAGSYVLSVQGLDPIEFEVSPGDVVSDASRSVGFSDFSALTSMLRSTPGGLVNRSDLDGNGTTDFTDFLLLAGQFGKNGSVQSSATAEPETMEVNFGSNPVGNYLKAVEEVFASEDDPVDEEFEHDNVFV